MRIRGSDGKSRRHGYYNNDGGAGGRSGALCRASSGEALTALELRGCCRLDALETADFKQALDCKATGVGCYHG